MIVFCILKKDADMKDMVVIDEFDALGDEIEVEMARLIDEQIEAARLRTKLEEEEKAKKEKEEAEKKGWFYEKDPLYFEIDFIFLCRWLRVFKTNGASCVVVVY